MSKKLWIVLSVILICAVIICVVILALPDKSNTPDDDMPITNTDTTEPPSTLIRWNQVEGQLFVSYFPSETAVETVFCDNEIFEYFGKNFLPDKLINSLYLRDRIHTLWIEPDGTAAPGGDTASFEYTDHEGDNSVIIFAHKTTRQDIMGISTDFELSNSGYLEASDDTISYIEGNPVLLMETPRYKQSGEYIKTELNAEFLIYTDSENENIFITIYSDDITKDNFLKIIEEILEYRG